MITVSWPGALAFIAVVALIAWLAGCSRVTDWHQRDVAWSIGEQRKLATALRALYEAEGYEWPDLDEEERPDPTRWQRVKAWALATWERTRPTAVEVELPTTNAISSELVVADDPEPPDTDEIPAQPVTQPDLRKASAVAPLPTVTTDDEEWAATRDRMLAEFRADMDKIQEGAK